MDQNEYLQTCQQLRDAALDFPEIEDLLQDAADQIENLLHCWEAERQIVADKVQECKDIASEWAALKRRLSMSKKLKRRGDKDDRSR